jgi:hypothetical protein
MPRPTRTRAAVTRAAPASRDPSPPPAAHIPDDNTDMPDAGHRDKGNQAVRRSSIGTSRASSVPNSRQAAAATLARQRRDSSLQPPGSAIAATSFASTNARTTFSDDSDIEVEMGRRAVAATPAHGRLNDVSGLDMDDDMFNDLNTSFDMDGPVSAQGSAQRSYNSSAMSTSHFTRRPRAGSFMSRDDGTLRPSSRAGPNTPGVSSTFNIGVFKRRRREPSILGTAQKPRAERPMPQSDTGDRTEDEAEEDQAEEGVSGPEDESTPLRRSMRRSGVVAAEIEREDVRESGANPRKRKSTEAHQQRARSSPHIDVVAAEQSDSDALSSPPSSPPIVERPTTSFNEEDIAPPMSSGSESEGDVWPPLQSLARGRSRRRVSVSRHTPVRDIENVSDMSSPPSLTYSPNYADGSPPPAKQTRRAVSKQAKKITTADLTGLLPRRRHRGARGDALGSDMSEDEVDASGLAIDEDELSYIDVQSRRRPGRSVSRARTANKGTARGKPAQSKPKTPVSSKPARTYGRSSDKENQEQEGDASDAANEDPFASDGEADLQNGDELKNAVKKFAEVDKWELEFEECAQSSSPRDAR